jgi:hypothetical protein
MYFKNNINFISKILYLKIIETLYQNQILILFIKFYHFYIKLNQIMIKLKWILLFYHIFFRIFFVK